MKELKANLCISAFAMLFILLGCQYCNAQVIKIPEKINTEHPRILTDKNGQSKLVAKLKNTEWAGKLVDIIKSKLDPYVKKVENDSSWMFSRLQMYWNSHSTDVYTKGTSFIRAEGKAPLPTVRYSGSRDWSTPYKAPKIENLIPFADPKDGKVYMMKDGKGEWVEPSKSGLAIERINQNIMEFAQDAAFLYWLTGEEKYAKFAEGIFVTYFNGLYYRNLPQSLDPDNIISGLTSFEVIHQGDIISSVLCYDFLFSYLQKNHPGFDKNIVTPVFKKWADNLLDHGITDNNWNILEARFLNYLALVLENNAEYEDGKGASFYLDAVFNQTNIRQAPLTESIGNFDSLTHIWNESPGYSVNVSKDFLKIVLLADRAMPNSLDALTTSLKDAVMATTQYLFPIKLPVSFGDGGYKALPTESLQYLMSWYRAKGDLENEKKVTQLFTYLQGSAIQKPEGGDLLELFFYVDKLLPVQPARLEDFASPTFYASNVSWFVQRNDFSIDNGMMVSASGSLGNHSHANGISIELYGKGFPLGIDMGKGDSYWQQNHREFYSQFPAHNTVIVDGKSAYSAMRGKFPFVLNNYYPAVQQTENYFKNITYSNISFTEPAADASQNRLLSIIRTSDSTAYYLDVFRSKRNNGKDIKNEYLYHNIGQQVQVFDISGKTLAFKPTDELSSNKGDLIGYNYFTEKKKTINDNDFKARFDLQLPSGKEVNMNMWMMGNEGREIFSMLSPKAHSLGSDLLPNAILDAGVPTLIIRQKGEAWTKPFVAVYEPAINKNSNIICVKNITPVSANPNFTGLHVSSKNKMEQIIFSDILGIQKNEYQDFSFAGNYGVASVAANELQYLFLANGKSFFNKVVGLEAKEKTTTASITNEVGIWKVFAEEASILFFVKNKNKGVIQATNKNGEIQTLKGTLVKRRNTAYWAFDIPALRNDYLILKL